MEALDLKKAYAEMILNTAKEAAERVMAAELKARRFQQDLVSTREEAARILLRTKQLIDAKTKEGEVTTSDQQRKIDELESQLNEAEDVILDLRAELCQAQDQLNEKRNKTPGSLRQIENPELTPKIECAGYDLFTPSLDSGPELVTFDGKTSCLECLDGSLCSYKGCTPAKLTAKANLESDVYSGKNQLVERLHLADRSNHHNNSTSIKDVNSTSIEDVKAIENTSGLEENVQLERDEAITGIRRSIRKRKLKFGKDVIAACGMHSSHQLSRPRRAVSRLSSCKSNNAKLQAKSGQNEFQVKDETKAEESFNCVEELPSTELKGNGSKPENGLEL